uniref:NiFeSe hydrogenase large subunit HysA n=1 Tax=uncultured Bilophila sp. TaxID=529385 RepID=UPI0025E2EF9F|nr:NiFeSe hydrogenase large subunit HysA [uncultured Bilophila sp.]
MSKTVIAIDPVTRLEGHLKVEVQVEDGKVADAWITGGMFRGFEAILRGRNPRDASQIVQRICGVCPVAHATASSMALEALCGTEVPGNGRIARNLMLAGNYLQSNILHFYHLAGQDYFRGPDTAPFIPRYAQPDLRLSESQNTLAVDEYIEALEVRQVCHQLVALFGGRMPHLQGILAGGAAQIPDAETILEYAARMRRVSEFVEKRYLPLVYTIASRYPDMFEMAHGYRNALCVGVFPLAEPGTHFFMPGAYIDGHDEPFDGSRILEDVRYSWFAPASSGTPIPRSESNPQVDKSGAYSFIKAPVYAGHRVEVGPLARMWINDKPLSPHGQRFFMRQFGLKAETFRQIGEDRAFSIMGRNVARVEEVYQTIGMIASWLRELEPGAQTFVLPEVPVEGEGIAFTEAPRGALCHYMRVRNGVIDDYAVVAASMWNCSPRDDAGQRGAVEEALVGVPVPDPGSPVNVGRVIRSYDP